MDPIGLLGYSGVDVLALFGVPDKCKVLGYFHFPWRCFDQLLPY